VNTATHLTIYAGTLDLVAIENMGARQRNASNWVDADDEDTRRRGVVRFESGEVAVAVMPFARGGEFLRQMMGAETYAEQRYGAATERELLVLLSEVRCVIGLTFEPPVTDTSDMRLSAVSALAAELQGVVFDGADFLSPAATDLIGTGEGRSDSWRSKRR
jgi:hypothetical protein